MAAVQLYPSVLRPAQRLIGAFVAVPATASKKYEILSDIGATDLADPTLWVIFGLEVETSPGSGQGTPYASVPFQCGPFTARDGTVIPAGKNRGFEVDASELAGKNVRLVCECRTVPAGTDDATVWANWQSWPFRATVIGATREALSQ